MASRLSMAAMPAGDILWPSNPGESSFLRSLVIASSASPGICTRELWELAGHSAQDMTLTA